MKFGLLIDDDHEVIYYPANNAFKNGFEATGVNEVDVKSKAREMEWSM